MKLTIFIFVFISTFGFIVTEKQDYAPVRYAVEGKTMSLPCALPSESMFLRWIFHKNGTDFNRDAAQIYPGSMATVFLPFNTPVGRSELEGGTFTINEVLVDDEGDYWCEISNAGVQTTKSRIYPMHVYVTPQEPQVTALVNNTLTEYKNATVARCTSQGGKPGSKITWMNGSTPMTSSDEVVYNVNAFKNYLTDATVDLKIYNPTRYDHNREFSCVIEHPAYDEKKVLKYSIKVMYHPINIRVWANLTSLYVFCEAEGFPNPTYHWRLPGGLTGFTGPAMYVADLYSLPGNERFECVASNGIPPNATIRVLIDDLLYPEGKPGLAGLEWWVWGVILGGVLLLIFIIIIIVICWKRKGKAKTKGPKYKSPKTKPIVKSVEYVKTPQHPTSLQVDTNYRTADGREDSFDSRTPSPMNEHKQAFIGGVVDSREKVTLVPNEELRRSRENMYADDRQNMHASREQLDMVASHIQTLNKSWDQLSKSRQALNETQEEMQQTSAQLHRSREQLYHSREALNRDYDKNVPYIDDGTTRSNEYYPTNSGRYEDQHDGYRQPPPAYDYDNRDSTYNSRQQAYDDAQGYDDRRGYDDRQGGYDGYNTLYQDDYNRGDSYNGYNQDYRYGDQDNGYRDDRAGYYRDDPYQQRDQYPPKRIV